MVSMCTVRMVKCVRVDVSTDKEGEKKREEKEGQDDDTKKL